MSRKYSAWASNQPLINPDLAMRRLTTVMGNEQDQLKHLERVEAIPHMYINVDAPPPPATTRIDARAMQPAMISRQNSSYFAAPISLPPPPNVQTKVWPAERPPRNPSSVESPSSSSKRHHKHKHHHHHHHHGDKHHHSRRHRAKSAESIRNRPHQAFISPSKMMVTNPQYIEQDLQQQQHQQQQQQQQQQPMIVYREVPNGEGYTVDTNSLAAVPYGTDNETTFVDDQQAPMFIYRDQQQQQPIMSDGMSQQVFFNQDQDTFIQQTDPFVCLPQQQSSQIVYCTDPNQQDYLCTSTNNNYIQQSVSSVPQQQQQFVCVDNTPTTMQPTIINQIPVFNPLSAHSTSQSIVNVPQTSLQRAASFVFQQPQPQPFQLIQQPQQQLQVLQQPQQQLQVLQQPQQQLQVLQQPQQLQVVQQPQQLQVLQQPQQLQVLQQPQPMQVIQQSQPLQIMQNPQTQPGQFLQIAPAAPQMIQTMQPQVMQAQPVLQTIQMPTQAVAANPQILYQRPYDPVAIPIQNQQMAIASPPLLALSQPSYAPSRIMPGVPSQGPNMFRHALLRTVADRTGVPVSSPASGGLQLMQPSVATPLASNPNLLIAGGIQRSASLPIVPLTPGGLLIPFQPSQTPGLRPGPLPRGGGYPSNLRNFDDIRRQMQARRAQLLQNLQQQNYSRIPSPPVLSAAPRNPTAPYASGNIFASGARSSGPSLPPLPPAVYSRPTPTVLPYSPPSFAGSAVSTPYHTLR